MKFPQRLLAVLTMALLIASGCGGGSSSGPGPTPPTPTVTGVVVSGIGSPTAGDPAPLPATAPFSDGTTRIVTAQATWESSNQAVVTVTSGGLASFLTAGGADIKATFQSVSGTSHATVTAKAPQRFALTGTVTDATNGAPVANANARVVDGPDAGKSGVSDASGRFTIADLAAGSFVVQFTRTDYETRSMSVALSSDTSLNVAITPQANVTRFYGTYNATLTIHQQTCSFPFTGGPTGTFKIEGSSTGSSMTITIVERGTTRTYQGSIKGDGSFSGNGGGVTAGFSPPTQKHEYTGSVSGTTTGSSLNATEFVDFTIPCPGAKMQIGYAGSK